MVVIIVASSHHAVWRDEVRALNIVTGSTSIVDLFERLHNEGHPGLWYILLYVSYNILHSPIVLKIVSILIAGIAIYIFLSVSPFAVYQKALFIFGYFPIYEYSVISRNYGIGMLLLFWFCYLYPLRFKRIISLGVILFLLAQTNLYSLIIVISIFFSIFLELIVKRKDITAEYDNLFRPLFGLALIVIGIIFAVIQIYPDPSSSVYHGLPSMIILVKWIFSSMVLPFSSIIFPAGKVPLHLGVELILFTGLLLSVWAMYIYLLRKPFILIIFFSSLVGLEMASRIAGATGMRYLGFFYLLFIAAFWLDSSETSEIQVHPAFLRRLIALLSNIKKYFICLLLITQVFYGLPAVIREFRTDYSSSENLGKFIESDANLKKAIIIGEPDYLVESLPYYVKNSIYIPRENRFGKVVSFTKNNQQNYSLNDLLDTAERLRREYQRPVIIVIGHELNKNGPYSITFPYGRSFFYDQESLARLYKSTTRIKRRRQTITDENYDVFLLN